MRTLSTESRTSRIGRITLDAKQTGERKAGNPPIAFDVAGTGNVAWSRCCDTSQPKGRGNRKHKQRPKPARQSPTLLIGRVEETSGTLNARSAPRSYPTAGDGEQSPFLPRSYRATFDDLAGTPIRSEGSGRNGCRGGEAD